MEEEEEEGGSSESSSEAESVGVGVIRSLQWKRGRLLGKGAFGKVWEGLLDSAQMIAVKEVELDIVGQKAQSVSHLQYIRRSARNTQLYFCIFVGREQLNKKCSL